MAMPVAHAELGGARLPRAHVVAPLVVDLGVDGEVGHGDALGRAQVLLDLHPLEHGRQPRSPLRVPG